MSSVNKRKSPASATSAFPLKRVKARVGKRALKPANDTDTSFRAVSLHTTNRALLASQSSQQQSLHQLTLRLSNVSSTVRKGALTAIQKLLWTETDYSSCLSILLAPISKCACVDVDGDARDAGYGVLETILVRSTVVSVQPFVPILTAYVASGLASLDPSVRYASCRVLLQLLTNRIIPSQPAVLLPLLPSFCILLQDAASRVWNTNSRPQPQTNHKSGSKRDPDNGNHHKTSIILQALVSLLKGTLQEEEEDEEEADAAREFRIHPPQPPHCVFVPSAKNVTNGVLVVHHKTRHSVAKWNGIRDLAFETNENEEQSAIIPNGGVSPIVLYELLERLRNLYVELVQQPQQGSRTHDRHSTTTVDPDRLQEQSLLVVAIWLVWKKLRQVVRQDRRLDKMGTQLQSLLMESFPVAPPQHVDRTGSANCATNYDQVNFELCCALMDTGSLGDDNDDDKWIKPVLKYVTSHEEASGTTCTKTVVHIMGRLLLLQRQGEFALEPRVRCKVLQRVCSAYFGDKEMEDSTMTTPAARRAVQLAVELVTLSLNDDSNNHEHTNAKYETKFTELLRGACGSFLRYLKAWGTEYVDETARVLTCLVDVTRRYNPDRDDARIASLEWISNLRSSIGTTLLVGATTITTKKKGNSLFEKYPSHVQRLVVSLIGLLESPTQPVCNGLSRVCAAQAADEQVLDYIGSVMYTIRRSIPMQAYLSFVIGSTGVKKKKKSSKQKRVYSLPAITANDDALRRSCRALCLVGSSKVLPAIAPVLVGWIGDGSEQDLARARAAIAILASLAMEWKASDDGSVFSLLPHLWTPVTRAICKMVPAFQSCSIDKNKNENMEAFQTLMRPVMALISCEPLLLTAVFEEAAGRIHNDDQVEPTLRALLAMVQSRRLLDIVRDQGENLAKLSISIESDVTDGQYDRLGGMLRTTIQALVGHVPTEHQETR